MTNKYAAAIREAKKKGLINPYMSSKLSDAAADGLTDSLYEELVQDAIDASGAGVSNDREYAIYFFTLRLADDILDDTFGLKVEPSEKKDLCYYILSHKDDDSYKLDNLTDYRLLTHKWLCDRLSKKAYPNTHGKSDRGPVYQLDKWIETLKNIYAALHLKKISRQDAIDYFTTDWDSDEKHKFIIWMKYYEGGNTEKYNVKTAQFKHAFDSDLPIPESWVSREDRANDHMQMSTYKQKREQTKREKELEKAKQFKVKMRSRLRSFKRLLEKYHDILPKQDLDSIYDETYRLEKSVSKLDVYASIQDCVIRSANRLNKFGFAEGADYLKKCAEEPVVGEEVIESLPEAETKHPDLLPQSVPMFNVQTVIGRLEGISKNLKSRDMIRELASIDILLNEMGMASYFPELTDAQSKLIEAYGYASNKVEGIVAKLRGSGASKPKAPDATAPPPAPKPIPSPPSPAAAPEKKMETGELLTRPVGKVEEKLPTR